MPAHSILHKQFQITHATNERGRHTRYAMALLLILVILAGCSSTDATQSSTLSPTRVSSPMLTSIMLTPATSLIGTAPQHCPISPPVQSRTFSKGFGGFQTALTLIGSTPVWASGILPAEVINPDSQRLVSWPATKIVWEIGSAYYAIEPVTVQVTNLSTGEIAPWDIGEGAPPPSHVVDTLVLNRNQPDYHGSPAANWQEWGSILYLFKAGCYAIHVTWQGGQWGIIFGVGR